MGWRNSCWLVRNGPIALKKLVTSDRQRTREQDDPRGHGSQGQVLDALQTKGQAEHVVGEPVLVLEVPDGEEARKDRQQELQAGEGELNAVLLA